MNLANAHTYKSVLCNDINIYSILGFVSTRGYVVFFGFQIFGPFVLCFVWCCFRCGLCCLACCGCSALRLCVFFLDAFVVAVALAVALIYIFAFKKKDL